MAVNDKIRALRELNNWSQEDMAERMNMSKSSYSRLEREESKLDLSKLEKLAAIFKIDIAELVTADDKGLVLLIGANGGNNTNYYGNAEGLTLELEKLKLSLSHAQELLVHKDRLIEQKDSEISALRLLVEQLQK
ncbi:helix-turn-helix domain-containing protein [Neisseria sp. CCUG12390]|uniref:helix-turn-helix domain-containing protein n=1 Tax=Neisseria sp. CCUG12390 TaxID=3392035 RepID=UPI003A101547